MHTPKIFTTVCLALALSLTGPGVMAKETKGGGGKSDRGSSKVVKRDHSRSVARSSARRSLDKSDRVASSSLGASRQLASRNLNQERRADMQRTRQVKQSVNRDRADLVRRESRNLDRTDLVRRETVNRDRTDAQRVIRDRDANRRDLNRVASRDRDRDRSHFVTRHERHDNDWFVRNNYIYDRDYWHSHHVHRYYNDLLGVYIISPIGPDYAYGSTYVDGNSDYYGFDYQTRVAVQQSLAELGYYNGPIDGMIGPGTSAAIERFQADNGLAITGGINNSLLQSLQIL